MRSRHRWLCVTALIGVGALGASCASDESEGVSPAATVTAVAPPAYSSATSASSTTVASSTVAPSTSTSTTTSLPPTMPPLPTGEPIAFSLPPTFVAAGVDVPVVVSVDLQPIGVDVVDRSGALLATLSPASPQFWMGTVPGAAVAGPELVMMPVARAADGESTQGPPVSIVVLPSNGTQIERREADAVTAVVYDRPWSGEPGELDWIPPEGDGVSTNPPGIAPVSDNEVAVLDTAARRVTCFRVDGQSTCSIPLPEAAIGDMFALGDGTLAIIDLGNRDGQQELDVLRVDPRTDLVDVLYQEHPLQVAGYPMIAVNNVFDWDPPSRTAWLSLPEGWSPPSTAPPDPTKFPSVDALHIDPGNVTRGPTVQRPATLRPDVITNAYRLLDGEAWVTLYDEAAPYYGTVGRQVTGSGVIWLLLAIGADDTGHPRFELVRWRPGDPYFEAFPIDYNGGELSTRPLAALDDNTVAVFDLNTGGRIRAFTFPSLAPR